jgi:ATP-dependent Clp protease ATP-binding subunit ClpB
MRVEESDNERKGNLDKVAEVRYGTIPAMQKELFALETQLKDKQEGTRLLKEEVTEEDIAEIVASWTGIPVQKMLQGEKYKLLHIEDSLHKRVVGQDVPIRHVAEAIRRNRAGLSDEARPVGSFIFLGSTGVGKTETAKALAEFLFDDEKALIRLDMTEYMEKHSVSRLIGSPPGYVGYEEGGQLTEAVRRRPYSVLLFDEIEKAHPDVFNIFLQILDDGRLTDSKGRTVNFKNTIIIMSSNIGSDILADHNIPQVEKDTAVKNLLKTYFRPEFLNRLDGIIHFHAIAKEHLEKILEIQIAHVQDRLVDKNIKLEISKELREVILDKGYDVAYGARPMKRVIQEVLLNPLAVKILEGDFSENTVLKVTWKDDKTYFFQ